MSTVHVTIDIDAPPQQVWDVVMNPDRLGEWVTIHRSMKDVSDNPLTNGATMDQVLAMRGVSFHVHWTLVEVTAPNVAVWEGKGPAHSRAKIRYELSGDGDGPTKFEYTNEFTPPGGRLGSLASRMIVGAASEREANKSLNRLKSVVERK
jgi:carbon monoxide dehydrogenase subunit G